MDLYGYFNLQFSVGVLNFMIITKESFNFVHVNQLECIQSLT
jgi:hypothetical protein